MGQHLKLIAYCFSIILISTPGVCADNEKSLTELTRWMAHYYLEPSPEEIPRILNEIASNKYFEKPELQGVFSGFLAGVFSSNPEKLEEWLKPYAEQSEIFVINICSALWAANSRESRKMLAFFGREARLHELNALRVQGMLESEPPGIESMSIKTYLHIGYFWGYFNATGNSVSVYRILEELYPDNKENNPMVWFAAYLSLVNHALTQEEVYQILQDTVDTADEELAQTAKEIIEVVDKEKVGNN